MTEAQRGMLAYLMGHLSGVHAALGSLEEDGVEGLDPARCSLEDAYGVLNEALTGAPSPEAAAVSL